MINKPLEHITLNDFQSLIDNKIEEGKTIEYKEALNINSDGDKKEFLFDVSSFANASGGDLIFGISEKQTTGLPENIVGIDCENIDTIILQMEGLIRDGLSPRIINN